MSKLILEPVKAADSIEVRLNTIAQCEAYIKATMDRYAGLRQLDDLLRQKGIKERVVAIAEKG